MRYGSWPPCSWWDPRTGAPLAFMVDATPSPGFGPEGSAVASIQYLAKKKPRTCVDAGERKPGRPS